MITLSKTSATSLKWLVLLTLIWCLPISPAEPAQAAHPFHASAAELEWNGQSGWFEVSLKLPGLVIEEELSRLHQRRINLESTADGERLLKDYVQARFLLTAAEHTACEFQWVGMEVDIRNVWVYFEIRPGAPSATAESAQQSPADRPVHATEQPDSQAASLPFRDLKVNCRLLETRAGQVNLVNALCRGRRAALHLTAEQPEGTFDFLTSKLELPTQGWSLQRTESPM